MNRAGAALGYAATVFGAREANDIADCPKQRHGRIRFNGMTLFVDGEIYCSHDGLEVVECNLGKFDANGGRVNANELPGG